MQQLGGATTPSGCTRSTATKPHGGCTTLLAIPLPRCAGPAHTTLLPVLWLSCQQWSAWALDPMRRGPRPVGTPPGIALLLGPWYSCQGSPACALKPMRRGPPAVGLHQMLQAGAVALAYCPGLTAVRAAAAGVVTGAASLGCEAASKAAALQLSKSCFAGGPLVVRLPAQSSLPQAGWTHPGWCQAPGHQAGRCHRGHWNAQQGGGVCVEDRDVTSLAVAPVLQ